MCGGDTTFSRPQKLPRFCATSNGAPVFARTSSTVTPSANSMSTKPASGGREAGIWGLACETSRWLLSGSRGSATTHRVGLGSSRSLTLTGYDVKNGQLSDDTIDHALARQGERARHQDLVGAPLGGVLHRHHHAGSGAHQVHCAAHALDLQM